MSFLPKDYEAPKSNTNYLKIASDSTVKIRIMTPAVTGFEYFNKDKKPVRSKKRWTSNPPDIMWGDDGKPTAIKHFWAMVVWDYDDNCLKIWSITQSTIQNQLLAYSKDSDFGDPLTYDLKVSKTGQKLTTEYSVKALSVKETPEIATSALKSTPINLEALFTGQNPFDTKPEDLKQPATIEDDVIDFSDIVSSDDVPFL